MHGEALRRLTKDDALVEQIKKDYTKHTLDPADRAMLDHVDKLNRTPGQMSKNDIQKLKDHGFSDKDILDITHITAFFNFVNRVSGGLGVELG